MKYVKIDPPGTFCNYEALADVLRGRGFSTFLDVGCGGGDISKNLCERGMTGIGVDFSERAIAIAKQNLRDYIATDRYKLCFGDIRDLSEDIPKVDMAISYMVMEHIEDDVGFIRQIAKFVKKDGIVILGVPGRKDCWSFEDETVGHLRRYDRSDLLMTLDKADLAEVEVISVAVPIANLLLKFGSMLVKHSHEAKKVGQTQREQTETSGIRDIPWKTVFPSWVKIVLNRYSLSPLFIIQRLFYRSSYGVTMMAIGRVKN